MTVALSILIGVICLQGLAKFVVWFTVPYEKRRQRFQKYYQRGNRVISRYDTLSLIVVLILVGLWLASGAQRLGFAVGLISGMTLIQTWIHRFNHVLPDDRAPEAHAPPRQQLTYAYQANPELGWREIPIMATLLIGCIVSLFIGSVP